MCVPGSVENKIIVCYSGDSELVGQGLHLLLSLNLARGHVAALVRTIKHFYGNSSLVCYFAFWTWCTNMHFYGNSSLFRILNLMWAYYRSNRRVIHVNYFALWTCKQNSVLFLQGINLTVKSEIQFYFWPMNTYFWMLPCDSSSYLSVKKIMVEIKFVFWK